MALPRAGKASGHYRQIRLQDLGGAGKVSSQIRSSMSPKLPQFVPYIPIWPARSASGTHPTMQRLVPRQYPSKLTALHVRRRQRRRGKDSRKRRALSRARLGASPVQDIDIEEATRYRPTS